MVLGLKTKKGASIKVDYLINLQEIKPWPPTDSLKSLRSLLIYWENGERNSGYFTCDVVDGAVESKEFYRVPVTLRKESSKKGTFSERFLKNVIEFTIYEDRKDKGGKGQQIGSAVVNLAEYGIIKSAKCISCPISLKKHSRNALSSALYVVVKPYEIDNALTEGDPSQDRAESIPDATNEGNDIESEFASFTDDDVDDDLSSLSSRDCQSVASEHAKDLATQYDKNQAGPKNTTMGALSSEVTSSLVHHASGLDQHEDFSHPSLSDRATGFTWQRDDGKNSGENLANISVSTFSSGAIHSTQEILKVNADVEEAFQDESSEKFSQPSAYVTNDKIQPRTYNSSLSMASTGVQGGTRRDKMKHLKSVQIHYDSLEGTRSFDNAINPDKAIKNDAPTDVKKNSVPAREKIDHAFECEKADSVAQSGVERDSSRSIVTSEQHKIIDKQSHLNDVASQDFKMETSSEIAKWKEKVASLEEELMEIAAVEIGIYSVVAEHGSSTNKVLAPARRLSRFYLHACTSNTLNKRTGAARAIISGLLSVSKACGNDVPRLTFWLSNAIVLRATITRSVRKSHGIVHQTGEKLKKSNRSIVQETGSTGAMSVVGTKEEHQTFIDALANFEAWIFSRIVESIWWQTLTPHMQCTAVSGLSSKKSNKWNRLGIQEGEKLAIDLWKKAFRDACERLCPVRGGGHECGCLAALLPKLVMEQLIVRLDVAMFNAILRESVEDMPTDPISDPISDLRVLPIPAGKLSFGAGVNLKNAVGSWSRWLTDLFGIEDSELEGQEDKSDGEGKHMDTAFKSFHLLNALSDLMMLPFELLVDKATRTEVCPTFGSALIKRVLYHFSSDEFNPNPMSDMVIDALDSEEIGNNEEEPGTHFPYSAAPIVYSPPSAESLARFIGSLSSQSLQCEGSVIQKSFTSDDELDDLDSPMSPVMLDKSRSSDTHTANNWMQIGKWGRRTNRYQLLREAWKGEELQ